MRILHIMAGKSSGGAETYSTDVMLSLHQAGIDQYVVMPETALRTAMLVKAGLQVDTQILRRPFPPWQRLQMRRLIAHEKPDIIHCWMRRAASLVSGLDTKKTPLIGWFGNYKDMRHFVHCTHFVGVTNDIVAHMKKNGAPETKTSYIPTFPSVEDMPALDRATLKTPNDAKVLLTLSRLHPAKGLDTLMQAVKNIPDCYLWLAGEGPLRNDLENLSLQLGIQNRVRFLGWRTDRGALLRAADLCVLPSRYEPFGTVILEAWATRIPLVACRSAGPAAYIRHGINGMLGPVDDAGELARNIRSLIDDGDLRQKIVTCGYEDYHSHYTRETVTGQWIHYYQDLANASHDCR